MGLKIYVAMIADRHSDTEPELFAHREDAIRYAREWARDSAHYPGDFEEQETPDGWLYYATYSPESDSVWVLEKELDVELSKTHD